MVPQATNLATRSALISLPDPSNPRFRILESSVQMLDKQSVNNIFYFFFQRNCVGNGGV